MPTNLELQEMIEKIAEYIKDLAALFEELFEGLTITFKGYKSPYAADEDAE